jgi:hypothetical protein
MVFKQREGFREVCGAGSLEVAVVCLVEYGFQERPERRVILHQLDL